MPPTTTSTSAPTSFAAAASAASSSVALSSTNSSIGRPSRPPFALMSSITILATLTLAMPMNDRAPVWSVTRPTRAETIDCAGHRRPLGAVGAEQRRGLRLAQVAGFLAGSAARRGRTRRRPSPARPSRRAPRRGSPRWGRGTRSRPSEPWSCTLLGALGAEDLEESVDVLDRRGGQDHESPLSVWILRIRFAPAGSVGVKGHCADGNPGSGIGRPTHFRATYSGWRTPGPGAIGRRPPGRSTTRCCDGPAGRRGPVGDPDLRCRCSARGAPRSAVEMKSCGGDLAEVRPSARSRRTSTSRRLRPPGRSWRPAGSGSRRASVDLPERA